MLEEAPSLFLDPGKILESLMPAAGNYTSVRQKRNVASVTMLLAWQCREVEAIPLFEELLVNLFSEPHDPETLLDATIAAWALARKSEARHTLASGRCLAALHSVLVQAWAWAMNSHEYLEILESTLGAIWAMLYAEGMSERLDGVGLLDVLCDIVLSLVPAAVDLADNAFLSRQIFDEHEVNIVSSTKMKGDSRKMKDEEEEQDGEGTALQGLGSRRRKPKKVKRKRYFSTIDEKSLPRNALSNAACLAMQALRVAVAKDHALAEVAFRKKIPAASLAIALSTTNDIDACVRVGAAELLRMCLLKQPEYSKLALLNADDASLDEGKVLQSAQRRRSIEGKEASEVEEGKSATAEGSKEEKEEGKGAEENEGNEELEKNSFDLPWAQESFIDLFAITFLMVSRVDELQEFGAKLIAALAISGSMKRIGRKLGVLTVLLHYCSGNPRRQRTIYAMQAVLNMSTVPKNQVFIGKKSFKMIMQQATSKSSSPTRTLARKVVSNLARHGANRTRIYKEELRLKQEKAHGRLQPIGDRDYLERFRMEHKLRPEGKERGAEGMDCCGRHHRYGSPELRGTSLMTGLTISLGIMLLLEEGPLLQRLLARALSASFKGVNHLSFALIGPCRGSKEESLMIVWSAPQRKIRSSIIFAALLAKCSVGRRSSSDDEDDNNNLERGLQQLLLGDVQQQASYGLLA